MSLGIVGRLVLQGSIDNRDKIIHVLEADRIGDNNDLCSALYIYLSGAIIVPCELRPE